jgi:hypothetical protein
MFTRPGRPSGGHRNGVRCADQEPPELASAGRFLRATVRGGTMYSQIGPDPCSSPPLASWRALASSSRIRSGPRNGGSDSVSSDLGTGTPASGTRPGRSSGGLRNGARCADQEPPELARAGRCLRATRRGGRRTRRSVPIVAHRHHWQTGGRSPTIPAYHPALRTEATIPCRQTSVRACRRQARARAPDAVSNPGHRDTRSQILRGPQPSPRSETDSDRRGHPPGNLHELFCSNG